MKIWNVLAGGSVLAILLLQHSCTAPGLKSPLPSPVPSAGLVPPPEVTVWIRGLAFQPQNLTVQAGTIIHFRNEDDHAHTVTEDSAEGWGSPLLDPHESFDQVFDQKGTFAYHCEPHPWMKGTITVQ